MSFPVMASNKSAQQKKKIDKIRIELRTKIDDNFRTDNSYGTEQKNGNIYILEIPTTTQQKKKTFNKKENRISIVNRHSKW